MSPFEAIQKHYRQRDLAAREWKGKGGKVIGYMCDKVPEEMILAAGFFPLRISGDPTGGTEAADKYTEPFYEGFVRSMLDGILSSRYDFLDYLVIPHSRDTIVMLYHILGDIRDIDPNVILPEFYLYETLHTKLYLSDLYNRDRILDFKKQLAAWSGKEISDESLSGSITTVNENRMLLKRIAGLRAAEPPRISGVEALQLIGASMSMLKEEHNTLLKDFLEEADKLAPRQGVRLFIAGSPHDNLQFYELVESCGAVVVGEDSCWGNRYSDNPVIASSDPIEAVADRYQSKSPCPWTFTVAERVNYCLEKAQEAKAQGAIFFISEYDYTESFDFPNIKSALEENGIPTLCFQDQSYLISEQVRARLKTGIEAFVGNLKAGVV